MSKFKPEIGQLVVVSHALDATMWRVKAIEGFRIEVIDTGIEDMGGASQWQDVSLFKQPSIGQIKQHTAAMA